MNVNDAYAFAIARRSYNRPLDMDNPVEFETWTDTVRRVIDHQEWLWSRALDRPLDTPEQEELHDLSQIILDKRACLAGRTMWLGGTQKSRDVECSMFNCAYTDIRTVYDIVDGFWLLLNGTGLGFGPRPGNLFGFANRIPTIHIELDHGKSPSHRGDPLNHETYDRSTNRWTIRVGDSAQAWAKTVGKLFAGKHPRCKDLVLDLTDIRGPGGRLSGYGWICHGPTPFANALRSIIGQLNTAASRPLAYGEIHDCTNHLGTVLSTRRSAQIALYNYDGGPGTLEFMEFKDRMDDPVDGAWWRGQSNNTIQYELRPSLVELQLTLEKMARSGKGEPGIRNLAEAKRRAPWSEGTNPCAEILLPDKGFCNLVDINMAHPSHEDLGTLTNTVRLLARANYRQTLVDLRDGILQEAWHINNQNLRLCGVGLTGIVQHPHHKSPSHIAGLREVAQNAARSQALELGTQTPALVTTVKPSGTLGKVMGCSSGIHDPLGEFVFYKVNFMKDDPLLKDLEAANYEITVNPYDPTNGRLVKFPAHFPNTTSIKPTAIDQLQRYKFFQNHWADHNTSITVYYADDEIPEIARWLHQNWDQGFVSVSFLPRENTNAYKYYPQEAVSEATFLDYAATLRPLQETRGGMMYSEEEVNQGNCEGGACPVR